MKIVNREKTNKIDRMDYKDIDIAEMMFSAALFVLSISYVVEQVGRVYLLLQGALG